MPKVTGAVLAGGRSLRMGRDKALIPWEGRPLVDHVAARLAQVCDEVFAVAKAPLPGTQTRVVLEPPEPQTPVAGVVAALEAASHPLVIVVACDMPWVDPAFLRRLVGLAGDAEAVAPLRTIRGRQMAEPLHAVWASGALGTVRDALASGEMAVHRVLERLRVRWVAEDEWRTWDPEGRSFGNVNAPGDLPPSGT